MCALLQRAKKRKIEDLGSDDETSRPKYKGKLYPFLNK